MQKNVENLKKVEDSTKLNLLIKKTYKKNIKKMYKNFDVAR